MSFIAHAQASEKLISDKVSAKVRELLKQVENKCP